MGSIDKIISALAPIFAAGFAVQQLLEILTSFLDLDSKEGFQRYKKPILGTVAFALGWALASQLDPGVLGILKAQGAEAPNRTLDILATALIISAGTEGVNSILKFMKYSKEEKKREAAGADPKASLPAGTSVTTERAAVAPRRVRAATEEALVRINRQ